MRQAGIIAAAGLFALEHHVERLADDHANAAHLAHELGAIAGLSVEPPQTNIVWVQVAPALLGRLEQAFATHQILASLGPVMRLVTHLDVTRADVDRVIEVIRAAGR